MSKLAFDFLADSFLFDERQIEDDYSSVSPGEVRAEVERYSDHIEGCVQEMLARTVQTEETQSVSFSNGHNFQPGLHILKQLVLYCDAVFLSDPLLKIAGRWSEDSARTSQYLGYKSPLPSAEEVARTARFMQSLTPMVAGGVLHFLPLDKRRRETPIRLPQEIFAEGIPSDVSSHFLDNVTVQSLTRDPNGGWFSRNDEPLRPSRGIVVDFKGLEPGFVYHLMDMKVIDADEETREVCWESWLPDEPPDVEQFGAWVNQSIVQSSQAVLRRVALDVAQARALDSLICTSSTFIADLLRCRVQGDCRDAQLTERALNLNLSVIDQISVSELMNVRISEGEAFGNFRMMLRRKLSELRQTSSTVELQRELKEAKAELEELQVAEVEAEIRRLRRQVLPRATVRAVSLAAVVAGLESSLMGAIAATGGLWSAVADYRSQSRRHPAYLLWRLKQSAK